MKLSAKDSKKFCTEKRKIINEEKQQAKKIRQEQMPETKNYNVMKCGPYRLSGHNHT